MKKLLFIFTLVAYSTFAVAQSDKPVIRGERPPIDLKKVPKDAYEKGIVKIKFKPEWTNFVKNLKPITNNKGLVTFGNKNIDALSVKYKINSAKLLFAEVLNNKNNEKRHEAWGFHLWFKLTIDKDADIITAVQDFKALAEIETAEPEYKKRLFDGSNLNNTQSFKWTPNDPRYGEQWHYHNTGQTSGTVDADIDLPEAWDIEKGHSSVVVCVEDDGIQLSHPDLNGNCGTTHYNFVAGNATIVPGDHGTHVAGTIGAENNNSTGVCGIAGGNGATPGITLMSAQVFTETDAAGFENAPIWAADNGACISQNSWGYTTVGVYDQPVLDAIDYFNTNGGGSQLNGGISIYAAGNDGTEGNWYPGCYSGAFSVAATTHQDTKAWYSNYGTWVDISAPGGETSISSQGILSTVTGSTYAFYQGTSMACPHTSGVAALVISYAFRNGVVLNNSDITNILQNTVDNHYGVNSSYLGKLGVGRLNAHQALLETQNYFCTPPATQASNFSSSAIGDNQMTISWTRGNGNQVLVLAKAGSAVSNNPSSGTSYTANSIFGSGNQIGTGNYVVYNGTGTNVTVTGLTAGTAYHYAIYEFFTADNCYKTPALTGNATTTGAPPCTYCTSTGGMSDQTGVTLVSFNTINNSTPTKTAGYMDYTAMSTTVTKGTSYNLTVNVNTAGPYTNHTFAWIDWNKDCDFDDPGEAYDLGEATNVTNGISSLCPMSITIPVGAATGTTRMRVTSNYNTNPTTCGTYTYAEVEDYSIVVQASGGSAPVANFSASNTTPIVGETVTFTDLSTNTPTSWAWSFSPTSVTYVGGTNANSQNPQVQFNAAGAYNVTLTATNGLGSDGETKNNYINASAAPTLALIYDNGGFITHIDSGFGGADVSALQTNLGMNNLGFGMQQSLAYKVADNALLHDDSIYIVKQLKFFGYQTIAANPTPTTSTFTGLYFKIWNGNPMSGGTVVYDYSTSNMMTATNWSGVYRAQITALTNTDRSIMEIIATLPANDSLVLTGTNDYWVEWSTTGSGTSGPWANPLTAIGQTTTGDAIQYTTAWAAIVDGGSATAQGLPFKLYGRRISAILPPSISVTPSSLSFGNQVISTTSAAQTYTLTGSNLTANVSITAPTGFEVSLNGTSYASSQSVTPSSGSVNQTVYVRFAPTAVQAYSGNVTNASTGATTQNVAVSGTGIAAPTPTLSVTPSSLSFGNQVISTTSTAQTYTLTGSNLTANVAVTAPTGFEVSLNGTSYASSQSVTPSSGSVNQTVYVRFAPTAVQAYSGNVTNASTGATTQNVAVSGTGIAAPTPTLSVTPSSLSFGDVVSGNTSAAQTYTLTGSNLTADVNINAPTGFEISLNGTSYAYSQTVTPSSGSVNQTVYVRFIPANIQAYTGNVTNASTGANTQNVAVSGNGVSASTPIINVNPATLSFGDQTVGTTSTAQSYSLTGSNLTADVIINAPAGFQISLDGSTYGSSQMVTPAGGSVSQTVFVRFAPITVQAFTGNISHVSTGATTQNVAVSGNGTAVVVPVLSVTPGALSFGDVVTGTTSAAQTYTLTGSNLSADVTITAPTGFEVSLNGTTYASAQTVIPSSGSVNQTVYVRFIPSAIQAYTGNITNTSTGATTQNVAVSGNGVSSSTPILNVTPAALSFGNVVSGNTSTAQTYSLTGSNLSADVSITAPTGFEVSLNGTNYAASQIITPAGGSVNQTVYVRFTPTAVQAYSGNIINASTGASNRLVALSGNGTAPIIPEITLNPTSINFGNVPVGSISGAQSYNVTGTNLVADITVTAVSGFEVSLNGTTFAAAQTLTQSGGNVNQPVYVRFAPMGIGSYSSSIIHTSTNATTKFLAVSGNSVGIHEIAAELGIQMYPNPAKDIVNIQFNNTLRDIEIVISDIYGKMVNTFVSDNINANEVKTIDISKFAKGMYLITIKAEGRQMQTKLMVE